MSIRKTCFSMAIWMATVLIVGLSGADAWASQPQLPFGAGFSPVNRIEKSGFQELLLRIHPSLDCDSVTLSVSTQSLTCLGDKSWVASLKSGEVYETTLGVDVLPGDTGMITVNINGCGYPGIVRQCIITTGDSAVYHPGWPMPEFPGSGKVRLRPFDQPTELQLDSNLYEYLLDLRIRMKRNFVKSLPLELHPTEQENIFKVYITRDRFRRLSNEGVKGRMVEGQLDDSLPLPMTASLQIHLSTN